MPTKTEVNGNIQHEHNNMRRSMPSPSDQVKVVVPVPMKYNVLNKLKPPLRSPEPKKEDLLVNDDPPDHMEERARRMQANIFSRKRSDSNLSASSMPSMSFSRLPASSPKNSRPSKQKQQRAGQRQMIQNTNYPGRRSESTKSMSPISSSSPISTPNSSPLSKSSHVFPSTLETRTKDPHDVLRPPRRKQQSPHPADILKGQAAVKDQLRPLQPPAVSSMMEDSSSDNIMCKDVTPISSPPENGLSSVDEQIPNFTISPNLGSSETAEELRQLIEAMQTEFSRLRFSKVQAEAKAEKLQTDLSIQQQEMETHFESLSMENERLKSNAHKSQLKIGSIIEKVNSLEDENRMLRGKYSKLKKNKEVADAKSVASDLRANAAEDENLSMRDRKSVV